MRQIGNLANDHEAETFADYLLTRGITSKLDKSDLGVTIWIHEEDQLDRAREELAGFQANPNAERYREAAESARHLRQAARQREEQYRRSMVDMRQRWASAGTARERPLTIALIVVSVALTLFSNNAAYDNPLYQHLAMVRYSVSPQGYVMRETELRAVREGQMWRLFTPVFFHGGLLHLFFNMYWLYLLGGMIESRRGSLFLGLLVLATAVVSNLVQFYWSGPAIGMSGVVYALFGYIWMKSKFDPRSGLYLDANIVFWMVLWFVVCMVPGFFPRVANAAHAGGLVAGIAIGYAPVLKRKLLRN